MSLYDCKLLFSFEILMFILHSEKLNDFNDSYVLKDDKKIFFRIANMSIEKFKNIS